MSIFRRLFRRSSIDDDIREELEAHVAMRAEMNEASGMTPEEARHAARRQFGNATAVQERLHDFSGFGLLDTVSRGRFSTRPCRVRDDRGGSAGGRGACESAARSPRDADSTS